MFNTAGMSHFKPVVDNSTAHCKINTQKAGKLRSVLQQMKVYADKVSY